ncbi:hypothetical protein Pla52n_42040 [Stieleria varia]|uniref:Uncharacterized protein n=1 Tax=Stieleria varia TaxID=2528005 RepID=A0A5C6ALC4_9BACT|nr:hypothetical protein Pla52n_42040 [Stieleria varia]
MLRQTKRLVPALGRMVVFVFDLESRMTIVARLSKSIACPAKRFAISSALTCADRPPSSHSPSLMMTAPTFEARG